MRLGRILVTLACTIALVAGSTLAQEPEKKEKPAPASTQEATAAEKAKAEKIAAEKAAKEKADAAKAAGTEPEQPKAAVNTLEDLFAAYGMTWNAAGSPQAATAAPEVTVVWNENTVAEPKSVKAPVKAKSKP